jgi:hypothetical protein
LIVGKNLCSGNRCGVSFQPGYRICCGLRIDQVFVDEYPGLGRERVDIKRIMKKDFIRFI